MFVPSKASAATGALPRFRGFACISLAMVAFICASNISAQTPSSRSDTPKAAARAAPSLMQSVTGDVVRISAPDFTASAGLITFSEFALGTTNPTYQPSDYGGSPTQPVVNFGGFFEGQAIGAMQTCPTGAAITGCVVGSPTQPLTLDPASPVTFISSDGANPTSPVLSGTPTFNGPIAILFSVDQAGVGLDAGYFDALGGTSITAFRRDGSVIGSVTNEELGIEFLGLATSDGLPSIAGLLFSLVGPEPAGFAIDNLRFAENVSGSWLSPLESPTITQGYNCYGCFVNERFHVGIDMVSSSRRVQAAQGGYVVGIYRTRDRANRWCDGTDMRLDEIPLDPSTTTGFGNTVLLGHPGAADDGSPLYSMYAHLECIDSALAHGFLDARTSGDRWSIDRGGFIGRFGGSGAKKLMGAYFDHLHFEVREFEQFIRPGAAGYSSVSADQVGYVDPFLLIHRRDLRAPDFVSGLVIENDVIRVGPGTYPHQDIVPNRLLAGTEVVVKRAARSTDGGWYNINLGLPARVIREGRNIDNNSPEGWVHESFIIPYAGFRTTVVGTAGVVVEVYGDNDRVVAGVLPGQSFPMVGVKEASGRNKTCGEMFKLDLGVVNNVGGTERFGWVCGTNVEGRQY